MNTSNGFQAKVYEWLFTCFGEEISHDKIERNHRFLEEALELVQSLGCTKSEAAQLLDYVFDRPIGEPEQETGGVLVTLAALCSASNIDMQNCGETELTRVWGKIEKIREKQANKPKHSPLPQPIVVDKEIELGKSLFPLPSEWIEEFKTDWYKDNNALPKKLLNELWKENKRVFDMIYQYQRLAYEKNLTESQPKKDISDKELEGNTKEFLSEAYTVRNEFVLKAQDDWWLRIGVERVVFEDILIMYDQMIDRLSNKASSIPIIDKGENAIEFGKFLHTNYAPTHSLKWVKRNIDGELLTTKELYQLFKSQK